MNLYTRRAWTLLPACLLLLVLAAGCVNDESTCKEASDVDDVKLRFTVVTRASADSAPRTAANAGMNADTRAADIEGDLEGSPAENYLDLAGRDIRFLLFDEDQKYLCDFTPDVDITADNTANYITYTVRATLTESYFTDKAALGQAIDFYIMVLANGRAYDLTALALGRGTTEIKDVMNQFAFFTPATTDGNGNGWEPSTPGTPGGKYIPMAGLQHFNITFTGGGEESFVELSGTDGKYINMLRALAKIEVIDRIDITDNYVENPQRVSIAGADLLGYCATGTILPAYGQWNRNDVLETQQVESPTLPSHVDYRAPNSDYEQPGTNVINFHYDQVATDSRKDKCPVYSVYVPEYALSDIGNATHSYMRVALQDPSDNNAITYYPVYLKKYENGAPTNTDVSALLRNHIYRYAIVGLKQEALLIELFVEPWEAKPLTPEFE